jgi:radical SAM superfamily enzyme YgiQ (UPF0313 family)
MVRILNLIIQNNLNIKISFPNGIRGDILDDELILLLKKAGAYMITFAVETASPRLQKLIRKNLDLKKTVAAIKTTHKAGLITRGFFMVGFPTETEDEVKRTLRLAKNLPLTTFSVFSVIPFKGTALYSFAMKNTNSKGRQILREPVPTYFSPKTFYSETTGIGLRKHILFAYFMFFTPFRLIRYFFKIPRKKLYLRLLTGMLKMGFTKKANDPI